MHFFQQLCVFQHLIYCTGQIKAHRCTAVYSHIQCELSHILGRAVQAFCFLCLGCFGHSIKLLGHLVDLCSQVGDLLGYFGRFLSALCERVECSLQVLCLVGYIVCILERQSCEYILEFFRSMFLYLRIMGLRPVLRPLLGNKKARCYTCLINYV